VHLRTQIKAWRDLILSRRFESTTCESFLLIQTSLSQHNELEANTRVTDSVRRWWHSPRGATVVLREPSATPERSKRKILQRHRLTSGRTN